MIFSSCVTEICLLTALAFHFPEKYIPSLNPISSLSIVDPIYHGILFFLGGPNLPISKDLLQSELSFFA
jgi:hypothetical protein